MRGRTVYLSLRNRDGLAGRLDRDCIGSAGPHPCIGGMRKRYWGRDALVVRSGVYAYYMGKDTGQAVSY